MTDLIGLSINQYRLEKLLGDGGMGTVYMADDTNLERTVAIKLMHPHFARQEEFRERLKQEARTAAQLEHPSIVRVYDFGESDSGLYIAMEYVSGGSLRAHLQRLQKHGRFLPLDQALQIGIQIADALHYAHNSRDEMIVHRDVKPGNIILKPLDQPEEEGEYAFRAMLTDFGLVKVTNSALQTQTGLTMGTPIYMSPEQCQGSDLDGRSDLYSLAAVLYELLTNRPPFMFRSLSDALSVHLRGEMPEPPSVYRGDIPPLVDTILLRLLSKEKEKRFNSGQELANTLRSTLFSLSDSPTRVIRQGTADSNTMSLAAEVAPPGYFIQIESDNRTANYMPLTEPIITIGRGASNDMVLPTEGVSRHHSRLQAMDNGWAIVDLGGVNGTFLDGRRLRPNDPTEIPVNGRVHVGPYLLTLQYRPSTEQVATPPPVLPPTSRPAIPVYEQRTQPPIQIEAADLVSEPATPVEPVKEEEKEEEENEPLGLFLTRERLTTEPGQAATLNVEVVNRTARPDRVSLRLQGLNSQWYEYTDTFVDVDPHSSVQFAIDIQPPRRPDTPVGRQRFRVEVVSQQHSNIDLAANVSLLLTSYSAFNADIEPHSITLPAPITIQLHNQGNTAQTFRAGLDTDETRLRVRGELPTIRLEPGQQGQLELELEPARTQIFGNAFTHDYDVKVVTQEGERKTLSGEASFKPLLSMGFGYVLGIFMFLAILAMCVTFAVRSVGNSFSGLFGSEEPTPGFTFNTATPTFDPQGATATTQAGTATAVFSATIGAVTPSPTTNLADRDNDGLSDSNEAIVGTNPDNPDTDGDGLSDGVEALDLGTDPLSADTDGDILRDGDEINLYKTDPRNPDTDGDGINDGTEISQGQNPLEGIVAVTETAVPPTTEATAETPEAATVTPISVPTDTPESPSATETPAPPTETAVPATETNVPATETAVPATETSVPPTETVEPTAETPTEEPVVEPTVEPTEEGSNALTFALRCTSSPPVLDGRASLSEWGGVPLHTLESESDPNRLIEIYALQDTSNLYLAFVIEGHAGNITESVRLYIDATGDGGDPDISDRSWQSIRDGSQMVWSGIGTTNDGQTWEELTAENNTWTSVVNGLNERQWIIETQIPLSSELPLIGDPFKMALQIAYSDEALLWPDQFESINADTWEAVSNPTCS